MGLFASLAGCSTTPAKPSLMANMAQQDVTVPQLRALDYEYAARFGQLVSTTVLDTVEASDKLAVFDAIAEERAMVLEAIEQERVSVMDTLDSQLVSATAGLNDVGKGLIDHFFVRLIEVLAVVGVATILTVLLVLLVLRKRRSSDD
jgi:hypothetical protein